MDIPDLNDTDLDRLKARCIPIQAAFEGFTCTRLVDGSQNIEGVVKIQCNSTPTHSGQYAANVNWVAGEFCPTDGTPISNLPGTGKLHIGQAHAHIRGKEPVHGLGHYYLVIDAVIAG